MPTVNRLAKGDGWEPRLRLDYDSDYVSPENTDDIAELYGEVVFELAEDLVEGGIDASKDDVIEMVRTEMLPAIDFEGHDGEHAVGSVTVKADGITEWTVYDEYRK